MKFLKVLCPLFLICVIGCNSSTNDTKKEAVVKKIEINSEIVVHKDSLVLNGNEGNWYYKDALFNGFAVKYHTNDTLKEKTGFYNGKKEGVYKVWFTSGVLKMASHYQQNVLVGSYRAWWQNGTLAFNANYKNGKLEGVERQWYADGTMSKERHLVKGSENGLQRAWLQNGKIYVNYEAKNGRTFGMKRANLCYQLKNEKIEEKKGI